MNSSSIPDRVRARARVTCTYTSTIWIALAACGPNETPIPTAVPTTELSCLPNLDGQIDVNELPFPKDAKGSYWISSPNTAIDLVGTTTAAGERRWDWSAVATSDELMPVEVNSMTGAWFASSFPSGELVAPLDVGHTVVGVLRREASAIVLLGIASVTANPPEGKTLVIYDAPLPLYEFPIRAGSTWSSTGVISHGGGTIEGLPFIGENTFETTVDATGQIDLPELTFTDAYRLSSKITIQPSSGPAVTRRSVSFVFECFGEVARATARDGETATEFHVAQEVRRLGLH